MKNEIKARLVQKHDTSENWIKASEAEKPFIPLKGEIIVYDIDENYNYERFKIGDGVTNVNDLPFTNDNFSLINVDKLVDEYSGQDYINIEPKELGFLALQAKDAVMLRSTEGSVGLTAKEIVIEPTEETRIKKLATPSDQDDAANKEYVDNFLPLEKGQGNNAFQQKLDYTNFKPANINVQSSTEVLKDENGNVLGGAFGDYSATFSGTAQAKGKRAVAEGSCTTALGKYSHAEGNETFAAANSSHAEGLLTTASGEGGHAEGTETEASGDFTHAEGKKSIATGNISHAEGNETTAAGLYSHAEGNDTAAGGIGAHSEGIETEAIGDGSHAQGYKAKANGLYSHASGAETVAGYSVQTVVGRHNNNKSDTLFEVGNGSDQNNKSNAFEVYSDGHAEVQAIGNTDNSIVTKQYVDNKTYDWTNISNTPKINSDNTTFKTNISDGDVNIYGSNKVNINSSIEAKIYANGGVNIGSTKVTIDSHEKTIIKNVVDPVNEKDAVNKKYVDEKITSTTITWGTF